MNVVQDDQTESGVIGRHVCLERSWKAKMTLDKPRCN